MTCQASHVRSLGAQKGPTLQWKVVDKASSSDGATKRPTALLFVLLLDCLNLIGGTSTLSQTYATCISIYIYLYLYIYICIYVLYWLKPFLLKFPRRDLDPIDCTGTTPHLRDLLETAFGENLGVLAGALSE